MEIKTTKKSHYQVEVEVEVPEERWEKIKEATFADFRRKAKVDGFRPGKVPAHLLKRMYGSAIESEAGEKALDIFYKEALEQVDFFATAPGDILKVDYGAGKPFTFTARIEIVPEFEIEGLDKLNTYLEEVEVEEEDIDTGLRVLQEERAELEPQATPIERGNIVTVNVQELDHTGLPILTHNWNNIRMEIGRNTFGEAVDKQMIGKSSSDQVFYISKPEEDEDDTERIYRFDIVEIKKKLLPEVDDKFARRVNDDFQNKEDLRKGIKEYLHSEANSRARVGMLNRLVNFLVENNRIDVPPAMLESYLKRRFENARKKSEILDEEGFKERYRNSALYNLKWQILRWNIIKQHNLSATEEEIEREIGVIAEKSKSDVNILRMEFNRKKNHENLVEDIEERKVLEFLQCRSKMTLRKVKYGEYLQPDKNRDPIIQ